LTHHLTDISPSICIYQKLNRIRDAELIVLIWRFYWFNYRWVGVDAVGVQIWV